MKSHVKKIWLRALRSGKYRQTTNTLVSALKDGTPIGYCCLGVLCDLAVKRKVIPKPVLQLELKTWDKPCLRFVKSTGFLPGMVAKWAGLGRRTNPRVMNEWRGFFQPLSQMNDKGSNFKEIANAIEKSL